MLERFRLYRSAFPMVTYRLVMADQIMHGDSAMVPESLDRDKVEMSFMGDVFQRVVRASAAGEQAILHLERDGELRLPSSSIVIIEDEPQEDEGVH